MEDVQSVLTRRASAFSFRSLNWLLLVLCTVIVIVASFFLFYWNRLLGWFLGFIVRILFWKKHNVWLECEAFQLSLLAGRIVLKDVHYHSRNQSIRAVKCHITWRYWLWRVRSTDDLSHTVPIEASDPSQKSLDLPCRIHVVIEGLEVFFYNRTQAYDDIFNQLQAGRGGAKEQPEIVVQSTVPKEEPENQTPHFTATQREPHGSTTDTASPKHEYPPQFIPSFGPLSRAIREWTDWLHSRIPTVNFQDFLPLAVEASGCALVLGNDSAPSVFIADIKKISGTYGISASRSPLDEYKNVYAFKLSSVKLITRQNPDYEVPMADRGKAIYESLHEKVPDEVDDTYNFLSFDVFRRLANLYPDAIRKATPPPAPKWRGLARYMTEAQRREAGEFAHELEYGKVTTLLETTLLEATYLVDAPGLVPEGARRLENAGKEIIDVGNGDLAPEWGVELIMHGGNITWGPWADRQRDAIQKAMFPATYSDNNTTQVLKPGDLRLHTALTFLLEIRDGVTFRLPTRESSKDWRFDGIAAAADARRTKDKRPFGWIDVNLGASSTLRYTMSMVADAIAFANSLEVHLLRPVLSSSVNGARFWNTESCRILCKLPSPRKWNVHRQWVFDISFASPRIFLLRDHATLITDLVNDWTSGPPGDFNTFVPITYLFKFSLRDYHINLYLNEHNVIDYPLADDYNSLLILTGPCFDAQVDVPSTRFRPYFSTTPFWVEATNVSAAVSLPVWNTQRTFSGSHPIPVGKLGLVRLDGSYMSYSEVRDGNVEKLKLDIHTRQAVYTSYAWLIRYLLSFRDNYFGNFTNFSTLAEYLDKRNQGELGDPIDAKYRKGQSNVFDVSLSLVLEGGIAMLPAELYGSKSVVALYVPELQVILRLHDYFMELSLNIQPVVATAVEDCTSILQKGTIPTTATGRVTIEGIDIVANRLFGPQPQTSTYACIWEIQIERIYGILAPEFAACLLSAATVLGVNYDDDLNAPSSEFAVPVDSDVTFLKFHLTSIDVAIRSSKAAVQICVPEGIGLNYHDLASKTYSQATSITIPSVNVKSLLYSAHKGGSWYEVASISCDVHCDAYSSPLGWKDRAILQARFIADQDLLTKRMSFIYSSDISPAPSHIQGLFIPSLLATPNGQSRPQRLPTRPDPVYRRSSFSESEDEKLSDGALETVLAMSRAETPRPSQQGFIGHPYTDGSLSSGDESDDSSDSQIFSNSDTELSDLEDIETREIDWSQFGYLRNALNRYRSPELSNLADSSPFVLVAKSFLHEHLEGVGVPSNADMLVVDRIRNVRETLNNEQGDLSVIRLCSTKAFALFVTPALVIAIRSLHDSFLHHPVPVEHHLDSLFVAYLEKVKSLSPSQDSRLVLDVSMPCVAVSTLQKIDSPPKDVSGMPHSGLLAVGELRVDKVLLIMDQRQSIANVPSIDLAFRFENLVTSILGVTPNMPLLLETKSQLLAEMELSRSSIILQQSDAIKCAVSLGEATVALRDSSPIPLERSAHGLARLISKLSSTTAKISRLHIETRHKLIQEVLQLHPDKTLLDDPLSWVSTSLMVKSGLPHTLRTDLSWKFLAHMRHCLRDMTLEDRNDLSIRIRSVGNGVDAVHDSDIAQLGEDLLAKWNQDVESNPLNLALFQVLYQRQPVPSGNISPGSLVADMTQLQITIIGSDDEENVLTIGPLSTRFQYEYRHQQTTFPSDSTDVARIIFHVLVTVKVDHIRLAIHPSFMPFLSHLQSAVINQGARRKDSVEKMSSNSTDILLEVLMEVKGADFRASALHVLSNIRYTQLNIVSSLELTNRASGLMVSGVASVTVEEFSIRARLMKASDHDVLAAIFVRQAAAHTSFAAGTQSRSVTTTLAVQEVRLNVPRSALRIYKIANEWRNAYTATYEPIVQGLLAGMEKRSPSSTTQELPGSLRPLTFDLQVSFKLLGATLQVMHGTWLTWDFNDTTMFAHGNTTALLSCGFGLHLDSQVLKLSVHPSEHRVTDPSSTSIRLPFPSFRITGTYDGNAVRALAVLGFFSIGLKPKFIDDILTVQQHLGNDFNEWLDLYADTRRKTPSEVFEHRATSTMPFKVEARLDGFRLALEGPSSTQFVDATAVLGELKRESGLALQWAFKVTSLALSLAHHSMPHSNRPMFDRKYRSAYMIVEFDVNNHSTSDNDRLLQYLNVRIQRVHAVFQAAALGEFGDLVDYVKAEMLLRKDQRATELAGFRNKGQRIMTVLERENKGVTDYPSWLDNRAIAVRIDSLGMALPLRLENEVMPSRTPLRPSNLLLAPSSVKAFLFSIHSVDFATRRYESGHARIIDFSFQFVDGFDQSNPAHFEGRTHVTRNRMRFPDMEATLTSQTKELSRFDANAVVTGFELDLDPSIVNYTFSLVDVYRQGKERIEKLAPGQARANLELLSARVASTQAVETHYLNAVNSNIEANFEFNSGKIRLFGPEMFVYDNATQSSYYDISPEAYPGLPSEGLSGGLDVFELPSLHVNAKFNAVSASQKFASKTEGPPLSELLILATISTSRNTIKPSVLPFAVDVGRRIENRLRHSEPQTAPPTASTSQLVSIPEASTPSVISATEVLGGRLQLAFTLIINESSLELTCLPDVNVVAGLKWKRGTIIVTVQPNAREFSVYTTLVGLNVGLRHGYLQEDAVTAEAKKLNVQLAVAKIGKGVVAEVNTVSITVNAEVTTHITFQRLQDVLCFKAVWLDRIPVFEIRPTQPDELASDVAPPIAISPNHTNHLTMSVVVRIGSLDVVADLGTYISKVELKLVNLDINSTQLRTSSELLIGLKSFELKATEALSGHLKIPVSSFKAIRRKRPRQGRVQRNFSLLEITIDIGAVDMSLTYEKAGLLLFHSDPIRSTVTDDWSPADDDDQAIRLAFSLASGVISTRGALRAAPELIGLAGRVKAVLLAQKESAAKESKAFRTTLQPKPANPLSDVASSMLQAARSKLKETEEQLDLTIVQHMQFAVDKIQIEFIDGQKLSNIHALSIKAELERQVQTGDHIPKRNLLLSLGKLDVSTWSADGDPRNDLDLNDIQPMLKEVFAFPRLEIKMDSVLQREPNRLDYHFMSSFPDQHEILREKGLYLVLDWVQYDDLMRLKTALEEQIHNALMDPIFHSDLPKDMPFSVEDGAMGAVPLVGEASLHVTDPDMGRTTMSAKLTYHALSTKIDTPVLRQLGDARINPGAFKRMTGINVKESLPIWVHEYATIPIETIMTMMLDIYARRLRKGKKSVMTMDSESETDHDFDLEDSPLVMSARLAPMPFSGPSHDRVDRDIDQTPRKLAGSLT